MSSGNSDNEKLNLYNFTKILTLKVAQIVVQSRQGKKISEDNKSCSRPVESGQQSSASLQWFNLSIPDVPEVNSDTNQILNGEVVEALSKVLCIEIFLQTSDCEEMVLEYWTISMTSGSDLSLTSMSTVYYRMSVMLKSTLSISRITPAYKMSRLQDKESYKVLHKIYSGPPNLELLGENSKSIKVSELRTSIGTIVIQVMHRTNMTLQPAKKKLNPTHEASQVDIMVKSDHFRMESPKKSHDKKGIDLSKPLTAAAFVDLADITELQTTLTQQLPPAPTQSRPTNIKDSPTDQGVPVASSLPSTSTRPIDMPKRRSGEKYSSLMEFPFAGGSPITELASFYKDCLQARSMSEEWTDVATEVAVSPDAENLAHQLKLYEEAVPEFDDMVASMYSNFDNGSDDV